MSFVRNYSETVIHSLIMFADGSAISSGATFVTATNVATSKSINLNASGPPQFSVTDNTFTGHGSGFVFGFPPNLLPPDVPPVSFALARR